MRGRIVSKTRFICDFIAEKVLEWAEYLFHLFKRRTVWTSNLTESYHIYEKHRNKAFVEDFLKERKRVLNINKYKMEIKTVDEDCDTNTIGEVLLLRKNKLICRATLKTKESDSPDCKLIYWSFEN